MIKKHPVFTITYALIFVLVLSSMFSHWTMLGYITKPAISVSLIIFLALSTGLKGRFHQRLFTGLVFALTGHTLLMLLQYNPAYYLYGQLAFIICHLFYISAFYLDFRSAQELDKRGARIAIGLSAVAFTAFYLYLRPHLPVLKLPVLICIFIAALLAMMAAFRNQRVNPLSFKTVLAGVICFILTDGLFAHIHFIGSFRQSAIYLSAIYMIAQYLIIVGGVERRLIHTQTEA
jgi:hypothetical protein